MDESGGKEEFTGPPCLESSKPMFIGQHHNTLDSKGRVIVPSRIRDMVPKDEESRGVYLVRGLGKYLYLYTASRWEEIVGGMKKPAFADEKYRNFMRLLLSSASRQIWDRQGRIHIPEKLRGLAGISRNVVFVGADDKVEIWDEGAWEAFEEEKGIDFEEMASELKDQLF